MFEQILAQYRRLSLAFKDETFEVIENGYIERILAHLNNEPNSFAALEAYYPLYKFAVEQEISSEPTRQAAQDALPLLM